MKILFCIYQLDFADHIALAYLSAVAKELGHTTHLCVLKDGSLAETVKRLQPEVVAYSANIHGFEQMVAAHRAALLERPFVSIMGGPHPTFHPDTFAAAGVDAYCIGEGELAFRDFLQRLESKQSYDDVPNLVTARAHNPVRPLIRNLDELPFPDRDLTLANSYLKGVAKKTFYASRGCPFSCSYCCNNFYHQIYRGKGPLVRRVSVDRLIREIEHVRSRYRTDFIKFGDDLFALNADDWLAEFAEAYASRVGIPFNCYLRFDRVDERLLALLKKAGCFSVHLSVDSTSEHVRENVLGRHMRNVDIPATLRLIRRFGINTWVNFMLAAPESTLADDLQTITLSRQGRVTYTAYSTTVPMVGTELYDYSVAHGLLDPHAHRSDMDGCFAPSTLTCFSPKERDIRFNIFLVGSLIAKLPFPLDKLAIGAIRVIPPNRFFSFLRERYYRYSIENRIFRVRNRPAAA